MPDTRKRIDMKLPPALLDSIDRLCAKKEITRTAYFETLARYDLRRRKKEPKSNNPRWQGSIEDMPVNVEDMV